MRVTKLIKEYVEEQVEAKFPQSTEEKAFEEFRTKLADKREFLNNAIKKYSEELCQKANKELGIDDWDKSNKFAPNPYNYNFISYSTIDSELDIKAKKARKERYKKIDDTIKEILISLELGANRQELEEMLNNIGVNQNEDKI